MNKWSSKKTGISMVALVFLISLILGCSQEAGQPSSGTPAGGAANPANAENVVTLEFWNFFAGSDGESLTKIAEQFNSTHTNVKLKPVAQDFAQYYTKLKTAAMAGTPIDLAVSHDISVWDLIRTGVVAPIEDEAKRLGVNIDYGSYVKTVDALKYDQKVYAVPLDGVMMILYYNKDLLNKAGLLNADGSPKVGNGLEGLIEAFETVKKTLPGVSPVIISTGATTPVYLLNSIYYSNGGGNNPLVTNDGKTFDIRDDVMLKSLGIMKQLHTYSLPRVENATEVFTTQKAAFMIEGTWQMNAISKGLKENMGVIKFPQLGPEYKVPIYSHTFVLPKNSKRSDERTRAALEFIQWFGENNHLWAAAGHMPGYTKAMESEAFKKLPNHPFYMDQVNYPSPIEFGTPFNIKGAPELIEPLAKLAKGDINEQQTLDEMKKRMAQSLNK